MNVACPNCQTTLDIPPDLSGRDVSCTKCGKVFVAPFTSIATPMVSPGVPTQQFGQSPFAPHNQPQMIVVHAPGQRQEPRLGAGGWFTRAFAATSGYLAASLLFSIGGGLLCIFVCCGGCMMVVSGVSEAGRSAREAARRVENQRIASGDSIPSSALASEPRDRKEELQVENKPHPVTLGNFNRVQNGMSFSDVTGILGRQCEMLSEVSIPGAPITQMYMWKSDGLGIGNCNVTFQNDKVMAKAQFGLTGGSNDTGGYVASKRKADEYRAKWNTDADKAIEKTRKVEADGIAKRETDERQAAVEKEQRAEREAELIRKDTLIRLAAEAKEKEDAKRAIVQKRTRKFTSGKFSIEAYFVGVSSGEVILRKADETEVRVPLERLSAEDRDWIENVRK